MKTVNEELLFSQEPVKRRTFLLKRSLWHESTEKYQFQRYIRYLEIFFINSTVSPGASSLTQIFGHQSMAAILIVSACVVWMWNSTKSINVIIFMWLMLRILIFVRLVKHHILYQCVTIIKFAYKTNCLPLRNDRFLGYSIVPVNTVNALLSTILI